VIEIGANIGIFTLFFSKIFEELNKPGYIFAFEPSREAFFRLQQNLRANAAKNVQIFNCAVDRETRFTCFYEPEGHLTNGSLDRDFAQIFSSTLRASQTLAVSGDMIAELVTDCQHLLVKIDVEGAEFAVLSSLEGFLMRRKPDLVVEVLPTHQDELNKLSFLLDNYRLFNITASGLIAREKFVATSNRDYLLVPND
jgi:FkbM family methyltransferase